MVTLLSAPRAIHRRAAERPSAEPGVRLCLSGQHLEPQGGEWRVYRNTFGCVPVEVAYVPPRPKRQSVQVALTATVVGPAGEEIYVDTMGQIKVQFHWDREGGYNERSSCWIRPMHAWGGAGFGAQFIPRVGMEA